MLFIYNLLCYLQHSGQSCNKNNGGKYGNQPSDEGQIVLAQEVCQVGHQENNQHLNDESKSNSHKRKFTFKQTNDGIDENNHEINLGGNACSMEKVLKFRSKVHHL